MKIRIERLISYVLAGTMVISLAACGAGGAQNGSGSGTQAESGQAGESEDENADIGIVADHEQTTRTDDCGTLQDVIDKKLQDGQAYTLMDLGDEQVLLVADQTFSFEDEDVNAIRAEVFGQSADGVKYLGFLQCQGTATPLMEKDGMIFTAGHHYTGKQTVKDGALITVEESWATYDANGNETWHYDADDGEDHSAMTSDEAMAKADDLLEEYFKAEPVTFTIKEPEGAGQEAQTGLTGEQEASAKEPQKEAEAGEQAADEKTEKDPEQAYDDIDKIQSAISAYLVSTLGSPVEDGSMTIPSMRILGIDDSDPNDVRVYGCYWVYSYYIMDKTLVMTSGGDYSGVMHLAKKEDGTYVVTQQDEIADGESFKESAKQLYGNYYDQFESLESDSLQKEDIWEKAISDYVKEHDLPVTKYMDFGMEEVDIPGL